MQNGRRDFVLKNWSSHTPAFMSLTWSHDSIIILYHIICIFHGAPICTSEVLGHMMYGQAGQLTYDMVTKCSGKIACFKIGFKRWYNYIYRHSPVKSSIQSPTFNLRCIVNNRNSASLSQTLDCTQMTSQEHTVWQNINSLFSCANVSSTIQLCKKIPLHNSYFF